MEIPVKIKKTRQQKHDFDLIQRIFLKFSLLSKQRCHGKINCSKTKVNSMVSKSNSSIKIPKNYWKFQQINIKSENCIINLQKKLVKL